MANGNVYLFVPNIIGYIRLILMFAAFIYATSDWRMFMYLYGASYLLDAADGYAARWLQQTSDFGAVLDMVADRSSGIGLMIVLSHLYPQYTYALICLVWLDLISHFAGMYSSLSTGKTSHKSMDSDAPALLKFYYTNRVFLFIMCFTNEAFFMSCYGFFFESKAVGANAKVMVYEDISLFTFMMAIWFPWFALKQIISVLQLLNSFKILARNHGNNNNKSK